jgi:4-hydroxybenzoate polyprenyltransferase
VWFVVESDYDYEYDYEHEYEYEHDGMGWMIQEVVRSLRLKHILKNGFLFAGLLFSGHLLTFPDNLRVGLGFLCFTLVTWAVYLFNDIQDRELDRRHPVKQNRPLAAGRLAVPAAATAAILFAGGGLAGAWLLAPPFFAYVLGYVGLNLLYTRLLKHVVILDIMSIAAGFLIRVLAGCQIIGIQVSHWLLVCSIFLSLFLGFCKRRTELDTSDGAGRPILSEYTVLFLDQLIAVLTAGTILSFILYTVSAETIARFGSDRLILTTPFVLYGIFRFLYLIYVRRKGQDTAADLLADPPILVAVAAWAATAAAVIYF